MTLKGIDISSHQGDIKLSTIAKSIDFVIVKATEGTGYTNPFFSKKMQESIKAKKLVGFYHYAKANDPVKECDYFLSKTVNYRGIAIPVLDWEEGQAVEWVNKFCKRYFDKTGIYPWIYASASYFNKSGINTDCKRWVASWGSKKPNVSGMVCWQYTDKERISGYGGNLDASYFYGTEKDWQSMCKSSSNNITNSKPSKKTTLQLAIEVMQGKHGNGVKRIKSLGTRYNEVQKFINHINTATTLQLANEVIAGKYGNGNDRRIVLGSRYNEVQKKVNTLK